MRTFGGTAVAVLFLSLATLFWSAFVLIGTGWAPRPERDIRRSEKTVLFTPLLLLESAGPQALSGRAWQVETAAFEIKV